MPGWHAFKLFNLFELHEAIQTEKGGDIRHWCILLYFQVTEIQGQLSCISL